MILKVEGSLGNFSYRLNRTNLNRFKRDLATKLKNDFREGIINPPKTGRKYPSLPNRSSTAGEFPANQTGALLRSVDSFFDRSSVTVGSNKYYSKFLAHGTVKMRARKMSKEVLQTADISIPRWIIIKQKEA